MPVSVVFVMYACVHADISPAGFEYNLVISCSCLVLKSRNSDDETVFRLATGLLLVVHYSSSVRAKHRCIYFLLAALFLAHLFIDLCFFWMTEVRWVGHHVPILCDCFSPRAIENEDMIQSLPYGGWRREQPGFVPHDSEITAIVVSCSPKLFASTET